MDIKIENQSQLDLFPDTRRPSHFNGKACSPLKNFTFSPENMIVLIIVLMMVIILFFSFGVEKGKKLGDQVFEQTTSLAEKINLVKNGENGILPPPSDAKSVTSEKPPSVVPVPENPQEKLSGFYTVQIASFKLEKYAHDEAKRLEKIGQETFIISKGNYSIVCVGRFSKKNDAQKIFNNLKSKYRDCLVRRL